MNHLMPKNIIHQKIASLESYLIKGDPNAPCILLMHGYGANFQDLLSLSTMNLPFSPSWIFPNAPLQADTTFGSSARTWLPWDQRMLENLLDPKKLKCAKEYTKGLKEIEKTLFQFINELDFSPSEIFLGGFSQGSLLATHLALSHEKMFKGLLLFSGGLFSNKKDWDCFSHKKTNLPFFQSHGIQDPVLNYSWAQHLEKALISSGLKGKLLSFKGGHEIPQEILISFRDFLIKHST